MVVVVAMLEAFLKVVRAEVHAVSAAVTRHRRNHPVTILVNLGYGPETLAQLDTAIQWMAPQTARKYVPAAEQAPFFWGDAGFWDNMPAPVAGTLDALQSEGYRQGASIRLADHGRGDITALHVSFPRATLADEHRHRLRVFAHMLRPAVRHLEPAAGHPLSPRQLQVLQAAARGLTNEQIANHLGVSRRTVATHFENIYAKLRTSSRARTVAWAAEHGLLDADPNPGLSLLADR